MLLVNRMINEMMAIKGGITAKSKEQDAATERAKGDYSM